MSPFLKIALSIFAILTIAGLGFLLTQQPELVSTNFFLSPLGKEKPSPTPSSQKPDTEKLVLDIKNYLAAQSGTWGIAITPLTTPAKGGSAPGGDHQSLVIASFGLNQEKQFPAASVMKVLVAANLIHRADKNEFSLEKSIEETTLRELMRAMINRTDNEAWEVLNHFLGFRNLQKFGEDLGMKNFNVYENTISPADVNLLLASIYQNKVASANYCQLLLSFMENTETEDRITAVVPKEIKVYHKTGTWSETGTYSDVGIIEAENPFMLTILSENAPSLSQAVATIQSLTKKIFQAYNKS